VWPRVSPSRNEPAGGSRRLAPQHRGSFDFRQIREHAGDIARDIERRKADGDVHRVVALYNEYCAMTEALQQLRAARNDSAAKFAQALQAKADKAQARGAAAKAQGGGGDARRLTLWEGAVARMAYVCSSPSCRRRPRRSRRRRPPWRRSTRSWWWT